MHNCEVHSFVFSAPPSSSSSSSAGSGAGAGAASSLSSTPLPMPLPVPMGAVAAPAAMAPSALPLGARARTLTVAAAAAAAAAAVAGGRTATTSGIGGGAAGGGLLAGEPPRKGRGSRPKVEAYLTGQGLALACAAEMPLPDVAHVNLVVRRFSGDGKSLTERQFSMLLARCGLAAQETRWLYCALDREGGGRVASGDLLLALMAFYSGEKGEAAAGVVGGGAGVRARVWLMDLRMRYQREVREWLVVFFISILVGWLVELVDWSIA